MNRNISSFKAWVLTQNIHEFEPGEQDVIRDIRADKDFPRTYMLTEVKKYLLIDKNACDPAVERATEVFEAYEELYLNKTEYSPSIEDMKTLIGDFIEYVDITENEDVESDDVRTLLLELSVGLGYIQKRLKGVG